ncbi:MAG: PIG-L family deacetylase, partial [Patescibacteria group bacterium]
MITTSSIHHLKISPDSRVLMLMPHPDDETILGAGLLQKLSKSNIETRVVSLTRGEKSTLRFGLKENELLENLREIEFANTLTFLGISDFFAHSLPDGGLEESAKLSLTIIREITSYKPTHIITIEPDGVYGHPDHIALTKAVVKETKKHHTLLYLTVTTNYHFPHSRTMAKKKDFRPIHPDIRLTLSLHETLKKICALHTHKTQFPLYLPKLLRDYQQLLRNG